MNEKRTKEIKIRLTDEEHKILMGKKTKPRLAEWLRDIALGESANTKKQPKNVDPALLYQLNRIGVNINQIARYCNAKQANTGTLQIAFELQAIEQDLKDILKIYDR